MFTEPDIKKKGDSASYQIYVAALDNILASMKGKRIFERFGFNGEKKETFAISEPQQVTDYNEYEYHPAILDSQNVSTAEVFSGFKPKPQLSGILANCVDIIQQ